MLTPLNFITIFKNKYLHFYLKKPKPDVYVHTYSKRKGVIKVEIMSCFAYVFKVIKYVCYMEKGGELI